MTAGFGAGQGHDPGHAAPFGDRAVAARNRDARWHPLRHVPPGRRAVRGGEVVLVTTAFGRQAMLGEYRDEYDNLLAWPRTDGGPFADNVEWRLRPGVVDVGRRGV